MLVMEIRADVAVEPLGWSRTEQLVNLAVVVARIAFGAPREPARTLSKAIGNPEESLCFEEEYNNPSEHFTNLCR
jgi:hypothetical protein